MAYVDHVGKPGSGLEGCSQLCNPDGTVVVFSGCESEELLLLGTVVLPVTRKVDFTKARRPELYTCLVKSN